jgi:hypothetical protein
VDIQGLDNMSAAVGARNSSIFLPCNLFGHSHRDFGSWRGLLTNGLRVLGKCTRNRLSARQQIVRVATPQALPTADYLSIVYLGTVYLGIVYLDIVPTRPRSLDAARKLK